MKTLTEADIGRIDAEKIVDLDLAVAPSFARRLIAAYLLTGEAMLRFMW